MVTVVGGGCFFAGKLLVDTTITRNANGTRSHANKTIYGSGPRFIAPRLLHRPLPPWHRWQWRSPEVLNRPEHTLLAIDSREEKANGGFVHLL